MVLSRARGPLAVCKGRLLNREARSDEGATSRQNDIANRLMAERRVITLLPAVASDTADARSRAASVEPELQSRIVAIHSITKYPFAR